ncbi:MAG: hypothetical protein K8R35_08865 [Bacteroidales bacterium]|nr:hypothetical protein [Bacteroidales bacterium]
MKKATLFFGVIALATIVFLVSFGCDGKQKKAVSEKSEVVEESQKEVLKPSAEMNDDIYVEITAYIYYLPGKYQREYGELWQTKAEAIEKYIAEPEKVFKKYGITEDAYSNYEDQLKEDAEHYKKLMDLINKRAEEINEAEK